MKLQLHHTRKMSPLYLVNAELVRLIEVVLLQTTNIGVIMLKMSIFCVAVRFKLFSPPIVGIIHPAVVEFID